MTISKEGSNKNESEESLLLAEAGVPLLADAGVPLLAEAGVPLLAVAGEPLLAGVSGFSTLEEN